MQYTQNSVYTPSLFLSGQAQTQQTLCASVLIELFALEFASNHCGKSKHDAIDKVPTFLIGGSSEPIYLPHHVKIHDYFVDVRCDEMPNRVLNHESEVAVAKLNWLEESSLSNLPYGNKIFFTRDYFASALHEVAHWCIAGEQRRMQVDYAYWYAPDGRDAKQQASFEQAEIKPQALEWAFSLACNKSFKVSNDNLDLSDHDSSQFTDAVKAQLMSYLKCGMPSRAKRFLERLHKAFNTETLHKGSLL
jgi:elongation factor P hydroxylase